MGMEVPGVGSAGRRRTCCLHIMFVNWGWVAHPPQLRTLVVEVRTMAYSQTFPPSPNGGDYSKRVRGMACMAYRIPARANPPFVPSDGDDSIYLAPEETQKESPPSYAAAQADAVPPYWETTTIHLPSGASASSIPGEMIIEGLPTGTLFSFLWNMLVSISFQFVGFLLTFLLHTTHAAKFGSRAGLGVTLIQFGFALRTRMEDASDGAGYGSVDESNSAGYPGWRHTDPNHPDFETAADADKYYNTHHSPRHNHHLMNNGTGISPDDTYVNPFADSTSEWASFLLMTVGKLFTHVLSEEPANKGGFRVVHPLDVCPVLLEGQEMGAKYPRLFRGRMPNTS